MMGQTFWGGVVESFSSGFSAAGLFSDVVLESGAACTIDPISKYFQNLKK